NDTLSGGIGDDTYVFLYGGPKIIETDTVAELAGEGNDTLDFSAITVGTTLDLSSTTTLLSNDIGRNLLTQAAGQAANFENALGGAGADNFTGNAANNIFVGGAGNDMLSGGAGRDILIGGSGVDSINGGDGEDILIGGTTSHDTNVAALNALMAEW